jgi:hypothetical protein
MATWNGDPKKFAMEVYDPKDFGYPHYEDVEYTWQYQTTVDILTVTETDSFGSKPELYGHDRAEALLYTTAQWYGRYEGKHALKSLLKDLLEDDDNG